MYYITVEYYNGEIFKYLTGSERDAHFFKTMADNCGYAIKQINVINLYNRKENNEIDY